MSKNLTVMNNRHTFEKKIFFLQSITPNKLTYLA